MLPVFLYSYGAPQVAFANSPFYSWTLQWRENAILSHQMRLCLSQDSENPCFLFFLKFCSCSENLENRIKDLYNTDTSTERSRHLGWVLVWGWKSTYLPYYQMRLLVYRLHCRNGSQSSIKKLLFLTVTCILNTVDSNTQYTRQTGLAARCTVKDFTFKSLLFAWSCEGVLLGGESFCFSFWLVFTSRNSKRGRNFISHFLDQCALGRSHRARGKGWKVFTPAVEYQ